MHREQCFISDEALRPLCQFWLTKGIWHRPGESCWLLSLISSNNSRGLTSWVYRWHRGVSAVSVVACQVEEGGSLASAAGREWWVDGGLCDGLELIGSTAVHLHGLPREQQTNVPVEVDLPRLWALEPRWGWAGRKWERGWIHWISHGNFRQCSIKLKWKPSHLRWTR